MSPITRIAPATPHAAAAQPTDATPIDTVHAASTRARPEGLATRTSPPQAGVAAARPRFRAPANAGPGPVAHPLDLQDPRNLSMQGNGMTLIAGIERTRARLGATTPLPAPIVQGMNDYMRGIIQGARISQTHVLMAQRYLERLPAAVQQEFQGKRLVAGTLMLAMKYGNDNGYSPGAWSRLTGIGKEELMHIELSMIKALEFDMSVGDIGPEVPAPHHDPAAA